MYGLNNNNNNNNNNKYNNNINNNITIKKTKYTEPSHFHSSWIII